MSNRRDKYNSFCSSIEEKHHDDIVISDDFPKFHGSFDPNYRGITEEVARKYGYITVEFNGKLHGVASYYKDGDLVLQKIRLINKYSSHLVGGKNRIRKYCSFKDNKISVVRRGGIPIRIAKLPLYGQWIWPEGGQKLIITEGEVDAMSVYQTLGG